MEEGPKKVHSEEKISQSLEELLDEVAKGEYTNFRKWLEQNNITYLNLKRKLSEERIEPTFMGRLAEALQDTLVTSVDLSENRLGEGFADEDENTAGKEKEVIHIKEAGLEAFIRGLAHSTQVTELNLSSSGMEFTQTLRCIEALADTGVTSIVLNQINAFHDSNVDLPALAQAIRKTSLTSIDLSFNQFNTETLLGVLEALNGAQQLTTLTLGNIGIEKENIIPILAALKNLSTLRKLTLAMNPIGDEGLIYIAEALKETQITAINLFKCGAKDKEKIATTFAECIPGSCLLTVELGFNTPALVEAIELNQRKFLFLPYEVIRSIGLFNDQEEDNEVQVQNPTSTPNPDKLLQARSILSRLPAELQEHVLSFLPAMNARRIRRYQAIAENAEQKKSTKEKSQSSPDNETQEEKKRKPGKKD